MTQTIPTEDTLPIPLEEIQAAFDAELTRLASKGLDQETETLARRYYSQKERQSMDERSFCGPGRSFPITSQADVMNAAHLIGHADNPAAVKACIIGKAKANGWKLPESWTEDGGKKDDGERAAKAESHPPFTGTHKHAHPAFGNQDDESTHEHEHSHDNDNQHDHIHEEMRAQVPELPTTATLFAPITRIDKDDWIVEGIATSEEVDSFGTIFSYEASKRAFQNWAQRNANVREMHDRKAVGKGIYWWPNDDTKQIHVRCKVSRGAPDTWQKVLDDVLCGFSVGAIRPKWGSVTRNGKTYPYLEDYDLAELSLVDNPSNPDCNFALCRADGLTDVVDVTEPEQIPSVTDSLSSESSSAGVLASSSPDLERAGARISSDTRTGLHEARDYQIKGAMKTMQACDCPDCQAMLHAIDPDDDGDIDLTNGPADTDHDADELAERVMQLVEARFQEMLTRFALPIQRMQTIAGTFAQSHAPDIDLSPIQQQVDKIVERLDTVTTQQSSLDEVRSALAEVKGQVEKIAAQPVSGGPVMSAAAVDPRFGHTQQPPLSEEEQELRILERLKESGKLNNHELQTAAAARAIRRWQ